MRLDIVILLSKCLNSVHVSLFMLINVHWGRCVNLVDWNGGMDYWQGRSTILCDEMGSITKINQAFTDSDVQDMILCWSQHKL